MNRLHALKATALLVIGLTLQLSGQSGVAVGSRYQLERREVHPDPVLFWLTPGGQDDVFRMSRVQGGQIRFPDATGLALPEGFLFPVVSANGRYWGTVALSGDPLTERQLHFSVYEGSGTLRYRLERVQHFDEPLPSLRLSGRDGALVISRSSTGQVWFYDQQGALIRELDLFPNLTYDLERIVTPEISDDGKTVAVLAGKRGAAPAGSDAPIPSAEPHLFLFTRDGELRWQQPLDEFTPGELAISAGGEHLAASGYTIEIGGRSTQRSVVYDRAGKIILETPRRFEMAHFSSDGQFLLLADKKSAQLIELRSGVILWNKQYPDKKTGQLCAVRIGDSARTAALLSANNEYHPEGFVFTDPRLEILDRAGSLLQELTFPQAQFREPALLLSPDAATLFIGFQDQHQIYRAQ